MEAKEQTTLMHKEAGNVKFILHSATTERWTSDVSVKYRTFVCHFFDPRLNQWVLYSLVLWTELCGGKESDIAGFLTGVILGYQSFQASRIQMCSDDN